jgi:hypothetical protein
MPFTDTQRAKAVEVAVAFIQREIYIRMRLNPETNPAEIWATVTFDGRIRLGTPVLHTGQGFYVNHSGNWKEA